MASCTAFTSAPSNSQVTRSRSLLEIGVMRSMRSAACSPAVATTSPSTSASARILIIINPISITNRERHARAPEGQLFSPETEAKVAGFRNTIEPPHVPTHANPVGEGSLHPAADIDGSHRLGYLEHAEGGGDVDPHQPRAPRDVWPQTVLGLARRRRHYDVAHQRGHAAVKHQAPIARLKEPGRVRQIAFDSQDIAEPHAADTDDSVRLFWSVAGRGERCPAAERGTDERPNLPITRHRRRGGGQ